MYEIDEEAHAQACEAAGLPEDTDLLVMERYVSELLIQDLRLIRIQDATLAALYVVSPDGNGLAALEYGPGEGADALREWFWSRLSRDDAAEDEK